MQNLLLGPRLQHSDPSAVLQSAPLRRRSWRLVREQEVRMLRPVLLSAKQFWEVVSMQGIELNMTQQLYI